MGISISSVDYTFDSPFVTISGNYTEGTKLYVSTETRFDPTFTPITPNRKQPEWGTGLKGTHQANPIEGLFSVNITNTLTQFYLIEVGESSTNAHSVNIKTFHNYASFDNLQLFKFIPTASRQELINLYFSIDKSFVRDVIEQAVQYKTIDLQAFGARPNLITEYERAFAFLYKEYEFLIYKNGQLQVYRRVNEKKEGENKLVQRIKEFDNSPFYKYTAEKFREMDNYIFSLNEVNKNFIRKALSSSVEEMSLLDLLSLQDLESLLK